MIIQRNAYKSMSATNKYFWLMDILRKQKYNRLISFLLFSVLLLVFNIKTIAQDKTIPSFITDSLDNYIEDVIHDWNLPGLAIGVVKDGEIVVQKGYGFLSMDKQKPVDENTLFMIGSNTKAFTATSMAMLENDKKCSLNDPVTKWVPKFKMHDPWVTQHANLIDIMSHRLGFETFQGDFMYFDTDLTHDEMLEKIGSVTPKYDFRTKWGYCNAGFFVAGEAIKSISGMNWNEFVKQRILTPLKMTRTCTTVDEIKKSDNAATGHTIYDFKLRTIPYGGLDLLGPAGSISSCVKDMNHWTMTLLDSGKYEGRVIIPQQAIT